MIYSVSGKLILKTPAFAVVDVNGFGIKVFISSQSFNDLPSIDSKITLLTSFCIKKDGVELYGFLEEKEMEIFELLTSISGVGPKTAMGILGAVKFDTLLAAIVHKRVDVIVENSSIGKKKAERIVLELHDKIKQVTDERHLSGSDKDVKAALKNLGYKAKEVDEAIEQIPHDITEDSQRLKAALKILTKK